MKGLGLCQAARKGKHFLLGYYLPYVCWEQPSLLKGQQCPGQAPRDRSSPKPRKTCWETQPCCCRGCFRSRAFLLQGAACRCPVLHFGVLRPVLPQALGCRGAQQHQPCPAPSEGSGVCAGGTVQGTTMTCGAVCAMPQPTGAPGNGAGPGEHPQAETPEQEVRRGGCTCPSLLSESIWGCEQNRKPEALPGADSSTCSTQGTHTAPCPQRDSGSTCSPKEKPISAAFP